jgi:predicted helicase
MNFETILAKYRNEAISESYKGSSFEKLMVNFLKTYQVYDQRFSHVWRWQNCPFRHEIRGKDIGIDIVAQNINGDGLFSVNAIKKTLTYPSTAWTVFLDQAERNSKTRLVLSRNSKFGSGYPRPTTGVPRLSMN